MEIAYIGLGSNLQDPIDQIKRALIEIADLPNTNCLAYSSLYISPPLGALKQPDYINAVIKIETDLSPTGLLANLLEIEQAHHRVRKERWGARTLDCDLLLYGQRVIKEENLTVPHPEMTLRPFVLLPLAEIEPDLILPNGHPLTFYLDRCEISLLKKLIA
jgi:2-amino-4-hydroxy-6-hydroxymethyldihydropteridine diphosphokinase